MLAASPAVRADRFTSVLAATGGVAGALLVVALGARLSMVIPWAVALLGGEYALFLAIGEEGIDGLAPLYGVGLLLCAELSYWSIEPQSESDDNLAARRLTLLGAAALASAFLGAVVLSSAAVGLGSGLGLEAVGVAAAVAALAVVARLARQRD